MSTQLDICKKIVELAKNEYCIQEVSCFIVLFQCSNTIKKLNIVKGALQMFWLIFKKVMIFYAIIKIFYHIIE